MKKIFLPILLLLIFFISLSIILFFANQKTEYEFLYENKNYSIKIPKYSYWLKNSDLNINFKSFSTIERLKQFKDQYLESLQLLDCSTEEAKYYYDKSQNITLYNYKIVKKFLINDIQINYHNGHYCNDKDAEELEKQLQELNFTLDVEPSPTCGKLKLLYSNDSYEIYGYCIENASIEVDGSDFTLETALTNNYVSMDKIVKKFDFSSKYAEGVKEIYDNDVLYLNLVSGMIVCGLNEQNKKYIIGNEDMFYKSELCG